MKMTLAATADNPRGVHRTHTMYLVYGDRDDAIALAVNASPSDVVEMICAIADLLMRRCATSRAWAVPWYLARLPKQEQLNPKGVLEPNDNGRWRFKDASAACGMHAQEQGVACRLHAMTHVKQVNSSMYKIACSYTRNARDHARMVKCSQTPAFASI